MSWESLGKTVAEFAPFIGSVLPIPGGAAIGSAIAAVFGGDANDPADLINRINTDPQAAIKLKELEISERMHAQEILIAQYRLEKEDRESARSREVGMARAGSKDYLQPILAILIIVGFFASIYMIMFSKQEQDDLQMLYMLLGVLGSAFTSVVSYYFGSSFGSQKKDVLLAGKK